jgi:hypothetical protein
MGHVSVTSAVSASASSDVSLDDNEVPPNTLV